MIGIIPAAGSATRMHGLPKFLLPIRPGILLHILCQRMENAGASKVAVVTSTDHADLVMRHASEYALIYATNTDTMSETVIAAQDRWGTYDYTLFGMPDTYWTDESVYHQLVRALNKGALVSAALFETQPEQRHKLGMCEVDNNLLISRVVDKPQQTDLTLAWGAMAWRRDFWRYIRPSDPHVGYALQRAVEAKERASAYVATGRYWDCGTPEEYFDCVKQTAAVRHGA